MNRVNVEQESVRFMSMLPSRTVVSCIESNFKNVHKKNGEIGCDEQPHRLIVVQVEKVLVTKNFKRLKKELTYIENGTRVTTMWERAGRYGGEKVEKE